MAGAVNELDNKSEALRELALFAGAGGGILGGMLLGWKTVCAVEYDEHARNVLVARQNDGSLEPFPIWDDVSTFDGIPWSGRVDIVTGGFPCQDISAAGKGAGITGERSGLWKEMSRIIGEVRPRYCLVENSPMLTSRGLGTVLGDLATLGYDARWGVLGASDVGARHKRERIWILAHSDKIGWKPTWEGKMDKQLEIETSFPWKNSANREDNLRLVREWYSSSSLCGDERGSYSVADRMDRLERIGNGQVPAVVELAWKILS